jgi:hypothetical protein
MSHMRREMSVEEEGANTLCSGCERLLLVATAIPGCRKGAPSYSVVGVVVLTSYSVVGAVVGCDAVLSLCSPVG